MKLLAVCKEQCEKSFLIETPDEINAEDLRGAEKVGVTAGASTPKWLIEQVIERFGNNRRGIEKQLASLKVIILLK